MVIVAGVSLTLTLLCSSVGKNIMNCSGLISTPGMYVGTCGQSYKASTIVIYNSRVVPDLKIPHITTLES